MKWRASLGALALAGCAGGGAVPPPAPMGGPMETAAPAVAYDEVGMAGWYGQELAGRPTASGDRFDPGGITAAHRTLSLRSYAEVTSLDTGRTILVRINDRGPFHGNRIIDLSRGAAQRLGISGTGMVRVRAAVPSGAELAAFSAGREPPLRLEAPASLLAALRKRAPGSYQLARPALVVARPVAKPVPVAAPAGTGRYAVQVASFSSKPRAEALAARINGRVTAGGSLWRVRLGPFKDRGQAEAARADVARQGFGDAAIVTP